MTECLAASDVKEIATATLTDFDLRVAGIPSGLCAPFYSEAERLEGQLVSLYQVVVRVVRKADDLAKVAGWWEIMVSVCDDFAERLAKLSEAHPDCGADAYAARVQELKGKCHRLQMMHV
jgi:hypothetical protein